MAHIKNIMCTEKIGDAYRIYECGQCDAVAVRRLLHCIPQAVVLSQTQRCTLANFLSSGMPLGMATSHVKNFRFRILDMVLKLAVAFAVFATLFSLSIALARMLPLDLALLPPLVSVTASFLFAIYLAASEQPLHFCRSLKK